MLRWERGSAPCESTDELAAEEPLEIRIGGRPVSVTMRTPGHDQELAAGFLLSEGIVRARGDIQSARPLLRKDGANIVNVALSPGVEVDFGRLTRYVYAASSCGLCGKATIEAVHQRFPPVESDLRVGAEVLLSLPQRMRDAQTLFGRTGGLHAAAIFDAEGGLFVLREDVGRHNAVDKAIGHALLKRALPLDRRLLLVSGRASFEIVQKALAARIAVVAAVSAPSSLAVEFARESGQTLIGFLRTGRMNFYAHPGRILL
ncbi:MAG: formate dehydrogenase accessory sulfurtransferase FdhD [Acidobacteria bacterium]|nr:formate dehydrogenase accessory sulfurtransferase FdhD [Acidobacteriota bacterium]